MTVFLRQSTASQEITLGRFVDSTDGNTEKTALTIANTDIKIWKTGATSLASKNSGGATHIANGVYYCVLDATDTDTIGPMEIHVHVSGALSVKQACVVLDEAVYDVLFGTTALSTLAAGAAMTLTAAYDPAKTAAQAGDTMKISAGTGAGQLDFTSGVVKANLAQILGTALTETAGLLAGGFKKFFNVSTPTGTLNDLPGVVPGANGGLPTVDASNRIAGIQGTKHTLDDLNDVSAATVKSQVVAAVATDTYAEPGQEAPAATNTLAVKIGYLFKAWRNKKTQTSTAFKLYADDGTTVDQKSTQSDDATTFTDGEVGSGP